MSGDLAALAKVLGRSDDPAAKHLRPQAIDGHPSHERILGRGDPLGQPKAVLRKVGVNGVQRRRCSGFDHCAMGPDLAALE